MNSLNLDPGVLEQLQKLTDSESDILARRARLILAYAEGMQTYQAAQVAGLSRGRARYWKREFNLKGMAIFILLKKTEMELPGITGVDDIINRQSVDGSKAMQVDPEWIEHKTSGKRKQRAGKNKKFEIPDLPYPEPVKSPGILPDDSLAEAGKKVLRAQLAEMIQHEMGTRSGESIEDLHDMRVATRRLRSAYRIFGGAYVKKIIKPYLVGLRQTGRLLGSVRDLDVFMEKATRYSETRPLDAQRGLDPLLGEWHKRLDVARSKLVTHFDSQTYKDLKRGVNYFVQTVGYAEQIIPEDVPDPSRIYEIAPCLIYSCLAAVRAYTTIVNSATIPQLHALRIEFKRLRYTLEFVEEVLGGEARQVINLIKKLQDHLGDLHDADVACQILTNFLESWDKGQVGLQLGELQNPEPIVNYLGYQYAERHRLLVSFPEAWERFNNPETMRQIASAISVL